MRRLAVDFTPLRASRDLRLLIGGNLVTALGTQIALVALPYQVYTQTGSAFLTDLLGAVQSLVRGAIVPNVVAPELLRSAVALSFGLNQVMYVVGPALGGIVIGLFGVGTAYAIDAVTCLAMVYAALALSPQPPIGLDGTERASIARSIGDGLRYVRSNQALTGSFAVWGLAIALAGFAGTLWLAALCLAAAGAADSVSAVCRTTINQTVTPDHMRGRMSSVFMLVVASGPRLGDVESGAVAGLAGPRFSVVSGGLACLAGVGIVALLFPALAKYDADDYIPDATREPAVA